MYCFYSSCKVCCPIYLNETRFNIPTLEEYVNIKAIVKGACLIFQHWTELWLKPFDQNHIKQIVLLLQWISVFWGGKWGTKTLSFNSHGEKLMLKRIHDHSSLFCSTFLIQNCKQPNWNKILNSFQNLALIRLSIFPSFQDSFPKPDTLQSMTTPWIPSVWFI